MSTEKINWTSDEFADYWDSLETDRQMGEDFMADQLQTETGKALLEATATTLANRHGVSSNKIKTFRMSIRRACKKVGVDILTPRKEAGSGTKKNPYVSMVLRPSNKMEVTKPINDILKGRMQKWVDKGECSYAEIEYALECIKPLFSDAA